VTAAGGATRVAGAPVSFGVYRPQSALVGPEAMLAALADAGYTGTDLGPLGYLGTGAVLAERLDRAGLGLAGGWVDLRYGDAAGFAEDLAVLDATLAALGAAPVPDARFAPRPTLACPPAPARFARPGAPVDPAAQLAADAWPRFAERVQQAADRCRERGLEPVFHHHLGTDVETLGEVEELLERTDVSLCLDTGHLLLAGDDPVDALRRWSDRIAQVHVKDARADVLRRVRAGRGDLAALVAEGGFCPLGEGDLDLGRVTGALREVGYTGWVVVEQDVPGTGQDVDRIVADQRANRDKLRSAGL
jgi:inosose dehydratase